jgi:hypothetical protein
MADDGETKDDVKVPEGEVGEKIEKLFTTEEKDTSKSPLCHTRAEGFLTVVFSTRCHCSYGYGRAGCYRSQGGSPRLNPSSLPYASTLLSAVAYLLRLQTQFAWRVLFHDEFLELWDICILMVVAWEPIWTVDITGYVFLALRTTSSFCYTRSYLSHLAGVVKKWTLGAWATSYPVEIDGF